MRDERLQKLARVLVDYSVEAAEGEQVLIAGGAPAQPLIKEVYTRVLDAGAIPVPQVALPGLQEIFFEHARDIHYQKTRQPCAPSTKARTPSLQSWRRIIPRLSLTWTRASSRLWGSGTRRCMT